MARQRGRGAADVDGAAPVTTPGVAAGGGGPWIRAPRSRSSKPGLHGWNALNTGWWSRHVPWAAHDAGHTHTFDQQAAWLAGRTSKTRGDRADADCLAHGRSDLRPGVDSGSGRQLRPTDGLEGLRRIGIDEISYRRGQLYLTVVVDHDTGAGVDRTRPRPRHGAAGSSTTSAPSAAPRSPTSRPTRPAGSARWSPNRCPGEAISALTPSTSSSGPTPPWNGSVPPRGDRLERSRSDTHERTGGARRGQCADSTVTGPRAARCPLRAVEEPREPHRPATPTTRLDRQPPTPGCGRHTDSRKDSGWRYACTGQPAVEARPMADLGTSTSHPRTHRPGRKDHREYRDRIETTIAHRLSNGLVESVNTKIRLLTRIAFGFHISPSTHRTRHAQPRTPTDPSSPAEHDPHIKQEVRDLSGQCRGANASWARSEALSGRREIRPGQRDQQSGARAPAGLGRGARVVARRISTHARAA